MIKLKDVIHLYLGCGVEINREVWNSTKITGVLKGIEIKDTVTFYACFYNGAMQYHHTDIIKPILRKLSDMTEEEKVEYEQLQGRTTDFVHKVVIKVDIPRSFKWLLENHFDLFGLIESGQAIDHTQQNGNNPKGWPETKL